MKSKKEKVPVHKPVHVKIFDFTCSAHGPLRFLCVPSSPSAAPSAVSPPG